MTAAHCPFCSLPPERLFFSGDLVQAIWDAHPVSPGHALLITRRHVPDWFDSTPDEHAELVRAITVAKAVIETKYQPQGYNIGINVGGVAGQTIFHLHVHVIPRYTGDDPDPRGGVRRVLPEPGNYLARSSNESIPDRGHYPTRSEARVLRVREPQLSLRPETRPRLLVQGGPEDPLLPHLIDLLDRAAGVSIAAAFTLRSGVKLVEEHLRDVLGRGGHVRILTGDYLGVTEPEALLLLLDLRQSVENDGRLELRVFESGGTSFHPKAYIVTDHEGDGTAFVGSSNLSETALQKGVEWNYRVLHSDDRTGFAEVVRGFDALWTHPAVVDLDSAWVERYARERTDPVARTAGVAPEPRGPPPSPHSVQIEALHALEQTRTEGNTAGLVVLATGLGKTWLSAFDSNRSDFKRILFIAHREEILTQAMRTFRRIRPQARFGFYKGAERDPDADVLFASIQTFGRREHLRRFDPRQFDYVIVDEFHHAAAQTYRRVIGYLEPKFLLGLTATPERTDGGDLLSLCGGNLVFRSDVPEGIRRGLLSPFAYFGVPDEVDYANIPWRSNRFDEEALTTRVATRSRAQNALDQLREHGGSRTVAFCVSQRHADFMAAHFSDAGLRAVAVHSGETSAPRTHSLERLEAGEIDVVFAVDMFNEGVDLPHVDTVLMLRPTESRILWLQQFGRGLRQQEGKTLKVIDYIGNHRVFLTKVKALFELGNSDREVAYALAELEAGTLELPPGCSVTYALEVKDILRSLIQAAPQGEQLEEYYREFRERKGVRPLAVEVFEDGFDPKSARRAGYSSWLDFVRLMGDLTPQQNEAFDRNRSLLEQLEITPMTKSYKILVLLAMIGADAFPGSISIEELTRRFGDLARRSASLRTELGPALDDSTELQRLIERNPIQAWIGGLGTGGTTYFSYVGGRFATTTTIAAGLREPLQDLVRELAEWRLTVYTHRTAEIGGVDRLVCRVIQADGRPFLKLPNRDERPGIPEGWRDLLIDGEKLQAKFVKIAVNVVVRPGTVENVLPDVLQRWFGPAAGHPGRTHDVVLERRGDAYAMYPLGEGLQLQGPVLWERYTRKAAAEALGLQLVGWEPQSGIIRRPDSLTFFVTLNKDTMDEAYQYRDQFLSPNEFQWQSQNRNTQESDIGHEIRDHRERRISVHLFVRAHTKVNGKAQPFVYCGPLEFERWEGERPITVWWRLAEEVPKRLWLEVATNDRKADGA